MKQKLDLILDSVESRKREVTFDVRDFTKEQKQAVIARAVTRGLDAASDGKYILVRDLRMAEATEEWLDSMFPNREVNA